MHKWDRGVRGDRLAAPRTSRTLPQRRRKRLTSESKRQPIVNVHSVVSPKKEILCLYILRGCPRERQEKRTPTSAATGGCMKSASPSTPTSPCPHPATAHFRCTERLSPPRQPREMRRKTANQRKERARCWKRCGRSERVCVCAHAAHHARYP